MERIKLVFKTDTLVYDFFGKKYKYKKGNTIKAIYDETKDESNGGIILFQDCLLPANKIMKYCNITYI